MSAFSSRASSLGLIASFTTALVFSAVLIYFMYKNAGNDYEERAEVLKQQFLETRRSTAESEVGRMIKRIENIRAETVNSFKSAMAIRVSSAADYLSLSLKNSDNKSNTDFGKIISAFKGADGHGSFFIISGDGTVLFHEKDKSIIGKSIYSILKYEPDISVTIDNLKKIGEGFDTYRLKGSVEEEERVGYVQKLKGYNLYIGSSFSVAAADKVAQERIIGSVRMDRYGKDDSGYFWIDSDEESVVNPAFPELDGEKLGDKKTSDGRYIFKEFAEVATSGGGFVEYLWPRYEGGKPEKKMAYVKSFDDWKWVVGTGFYFSELDEQLYKEKQFIENLVHTDARNAIKIISYIFAGVILVSVLIFRMVRRLEKKQEGHRVLLEQYKTILDISSIITITNGQGIITYVNDKFCEISGFSREELLGRRHNIIKHPSTSIETFKDLWGTITAGKVWKGVIRNKRKDGENFYISATIAPIFNESGEILEFIACANDVTELVENQRLVERLFNTDNLTGLGNRLKLLNDSEMMYYPVLAILDIKGFRQINELFGNEFADRVLIETARELVSMPSLSGYLFYRLHSDKFGILADNADILTFKENISVAVRRMSEVLQERLGEDKRIALTAGIAADKGNMLAYADMALKGAKKLKQDLLVYSPEDVRIQSDYEENLGIINIVSDALAHDRVVPYFQPIVNLRTGDSEKYECLMRIMDENGIVFTPDKFLEISKKTNMYPKLTARIIEKSVAAFRYLPHSFSINLSVEDIFDRDTMDYLYTTAKNNGVLGRLIIEIVESQELVNIDETNRIFERFKSGGTKIAIDDFGTGFSNFEYILNTNANFLKIDASIVKRVPTDEASAEVVASIVSVAKHSGMETVAEFIADEKIAKAITKLGVDYGQGYYYGKPEPHPVFINQNNL